MRRIQTVGISLLAELFLGAVTLSIASQQASPEPAVTRLNERDVAAIQDLAKNRRFYDFVGLSEYDHGRLKLFVTSNRAIIAFKTARAAEGHGTYTPPLQERLDTVNIECGDAEPLKVFECSRVRVIRLDKSEIQPLSYSSEPNDYSNASGDHWTVYQVSAVYSAEELRDGFLVEYASYDGTEWTFSVSADAARDQLLLKLAAKAIEPPII